MYLFDSDICIELMRGHLPSVRTVLEQTNPKLIKIPAIVRYELMFGALKSAHPERNLLLTETFLAPFETLPFDEVCAAASAQIRLELEAGGKRIGPDDLLIAGTARAHAATLVTNNVREYQRVGGIAVECWEEIIF